jgi:hypothetical protein
MTAFYGAGPLGRCDRFFRFCLVLLLVGIFCAGPVVAERPSSSASSEASLYGEYEIKAGFIYRFISFVKWPDALPDTGVITIGIFGANPFGDAFRSVKGRSAADRVVQVRYFDRSTHVDALQECHVLFITPLPDAEFQHLLAALAGSPVLLVGDSPGFVDKGGMIGFIRQDRRRIGIEINVKAADHAGLQIRSMLKRIAARIIEDDVP